MLTIEHFKEYTNEPENYKDIGNDILVYEGTNVPVTITSDVEKCVLHCSKVFWKMDEFYSFCENLNINQKKLPNEIGEIIYAKSNWLINEGSDFKFYRNIILIEKEYLH